MGFIGLFRNGRGYHSLGFYLRNFLTQFVSLILSLSFISLLNRTPPKNTIKQNVENENNFQTEQSNNNPLKIEKNHQFFYIVMASMVQRAVFKPFPKKNCLWHKVNKNIRQSKFLQELLYSPIFCDIDLPVPFI